MNYTAIFILLFCLLCIPAKAKEATPVALESYGTVSLAKEELLVNALQYLNRIWNDKGQSLNPAETKKYFTPNTTLIINGKAFYTGYQQFEDYFSEASHNVHGKIHFPLLKIFGIKNKFIAHFDENIYDNKGNYYPANVMAIFTIRNGKISKLEAIVNTKYFCEKESADIRYEK